MGKIYPLSSILIGSEIKAFKTLTVNTFIVELFLSFKIVITLILHCLQRNLPQGRRGHLLRGPGVYPGPHPRHPRQQGRHGGRRARRAPHHQHPGSKIIHLPGWQAQHALQVPEGVQQDGRRVPATISNLSK